MASTVACQAARVDQRIAPPVCDDAEEFEEGMEIQEQNTMVAGARLSVSCIGYPYVKSNSLWGRMAFALSLVKSEPWGKLAP